MKGRGQERCSHSQSTAWWHCYVELCACVCQYICLHMYICLHNGSLDLYFYHICALWTSVLSVHFLFLCPVALAQCLQCVRVFVFLGPWSSLWRADSNISSISCRNFSLCFCFNQPAGCTVAEGFSRGFTPLGPVLLPQLIILFPVSIKLMKLTKRADNRDTKIHEQLVISALLQHMQ